MLEKAPQTEQLLELVRQFKETKEIAMTVHLPARVVQTRLALHGYHRYYLTAEERQLVARHRSKEAK